jgi:hypothetical protein
MTLITACPNCWSQFEVDIDSTWVTCSKCNERYDLRDDGEQDPDPDPDFGGAFDGFTVTSDADPGL